MNMKKVIPLGIVGCLAIGSFSFAMSDSIEKNITKKPEVLQSIQEQQTQDIKVKAKVIKVDNKLVNVQMRIPVIEGMKDTHYEDQLNDIILSHAMKDQEELEKQAKENEKIAKEEGFEVHPYELFVDYSVKEKDRVFSLVVQTYMYTGGAHGTPRTDCYNVDLKEYNAMQINDLFKENADYKKVINEEIKKQIKEQQSTEEGIYFDGEEGFKSISDTQSFYIEDGNIVVCFAKYAIAPGASGEPEFKIPLKSLENILKDKNIIPVLNYDIEKKVVEDKVHHLKIVYPQIKNYKGELTQDDMNQSLQKIVEMYKIDSYTDVNINYEIKKMNHDVLSVLFTGTGKTMGKDINIQHSVNLDMKKSGNEIVFENIIKKDEPSKKAVIKILNDQAKACGLEGLEAEGIRIYFKADQVFFYYMPLDDSATSFIEFGVSKDELAPYMNHDFGELL
ncbi:DUF3298 and DUF4163 domain-containing protein [Inediibacterium massiliense]|uniref:DUF3298 and DUF4163 domain-containing protein n=1 Tax=Inediibacterium massiliense TaxID=1658111 RepID=UPI0006B69770|nr:DUF3298 and DUF4163 domain-containing protein [Inediibacterium massiliense]